MLLLESVQPNFGVFFFNQVSLFTLSGFAFSTACFFIIAAFFVLFIISLLLLVLYPFNSHIKKPSYFCIAKRNCINVFVKMNKLTFPSANSDGSCAGLLDARTEFEPTAPHLFTLLFYDLYFLF